MRLTFRHLRYFVTVAEAGGFARAADRLHLTQPSLSKAIAELECELGVVLFERTARGATLTPVGETFLEKAQAVLAAERQVAYAAESHARAQRGVLQVGFVGIPPFARAPELLGSFEREHPGVEVVFRELGPPLRPLSSWLCEVDVALLFSPPADSELGVVRAGEEPRFVLASDEHRLADRGELAVADVLGELFVGLHPSVDGAWAGFWRLDDHRRRPTTRVTSDEPLTLWELALVVASQEAMITAPAASAELVASVVGGIVAIPLSDANPAVLSLVWSQASRNRLVAALVDLARSPTADTAQ